MAKVNQVKVGSILSYAQIGLSIIIGLIYTPLMIRFLGKSEYGLYNTVSSTISALSILSLGFNSSYIRYYSRYKKNNDISGINNLNGLFIIIFTIIGLVALFCGIFLSRHLKYVFSDGLSENEYSTAETLMLLMTINLSISFPMSVFTNIISAHEKFIFLKMVGIIRTVLTPIIIIPMLFVGIKSIGIVCVTIILSMIADIVCILFVFVKLNAKFELDSIERGLFKEIFLFSGFIAINLIVDQVNNNLDKIIIGRYRGTEEVAIYSVGSTLNNYFIVFSTAISGLFTPRIHKIVNEYKDEIGILKETLTSLFVKVGRIQYILLSMVLSGFIFFGSSFIINFWAEPGYENSYIIALLLMIPGIVPLIENVGIEIQRALNIHRYRSIIYGIMAIANLIISIILCKIYGAVGSAIGTTIAVTIANGLIMNIFYHKRCYIDMVVFWKNILSVSKALIIPLIVGATIITVVDLNNKLSFLISAIIYAIIFCVSMWLWGMNDYERSVISEPFKRLIH